MVAQTGIPGRICLLPESHALAILDSCLPSPTPREVM